MYTLIIEDKHGNVADEFSFSEGSFNIGRDESNDIILPGNNVSRRHSCLFIQGDQCYIKDLGSSNGVFVDGQRISGDRHLGTASRIRIGNFFLYLEYSRTGKDEQSDVVQTHIVSQDENAHKLIRLRDVFAGEEFILSEHHNSIGRTDENYILLNDQSVSRRHAVIENNKLLYQLVDLGSSNGTFVNGRQLSPNNHVTLNKNDNVKFGNIEFIFVPNTEPYNPAIHETTAPSPSSSKSLVIMVAAVVALFCVFGSLTIAVYQFVLKPAESSVAVNDPPTNEQDTKESKAEKQFSSGVGHMEGKRWVKAISFFDKTLEINPDHERAGDLKTLAEGELKAQKMFDDGITAKDKEKYEDAMKSFEQVESGTEKHKAAAQELTVVKGLLALKYKKSGIQFYDKNDLEAARNSFIKSIGLSCDDTVSSYIRKTEKKMRGKRKFRGLDPFRIPPRCKK